MTAQRLTDVSVPVLLTVVFAWLVLLTGPWGISAHIHLEGAAGVESAETLAMLLTMHPPQAMAFGWVLMLVAMMLPMLIAPIAYVIDRSFRQRRIRAVMLFVVGYFVPWMIVGAVLLSGVVLSRVLLSGARLYLDAGILIAAIVWQCSPAKQRCLNGIYRHRALSPFGLAADRDVFCFGVSHGSWCVGSCWALMLLAICVTTWHHLVMAVIMLLMISERLEFPRPATWNLHSRTKLWRIGVSGMRRLAAGREFAGQP